MIELELVGQAESRVTGAGVLSVGRAWMNDLVAWDAAHVSGRHGQVEEREGVLWFRDLGSRNGSLVLRVDGSEVDCEPGGGPVRVEPGDRLLLGNREDAVCVLVGRIDEEHSASVQRVTTISADRPMVELGGSADDGGRSLSDLVVGLLGDLTLEQATDLLTVSVLDSFPDVRLVQVFLDGDEPVAQRDRDPGDATRGVSHDLLEVVRTGGEALIFSDQPRDERGDAVAGYGAPLRGPGGLMGALIAVGPATGGDEAELRLLQTCAYHAGPVLEDARGRCEDQQRIALLRQETQDLRQRLLRLVPDGELLDDDPLLGEALEQVERVAPYHTPVLIEGPSGTEKELVARGIHRSSERRHGPFLSSRCSALGENQLEIELFGHEAEAFPGAGRAGLGLCGAADRGTLLLDEVEAISLASQAKLLRVLQHGEVVRVGGARPLRVDVRIVAIARRDLKEEVDKGRFREDLYRRLSVFPVRLSPLADRPSDIPALAQRFAERLGCRAGKGRLSLSDRAVRALCAESWPGNVHELRKRIERAVGLCEGTTIGIAHVEGGVGQDVSAAGFPLLKEARRQFTIQHVNRALELAGGVQREAARLLGLDPGNLSRLLRELGLR